MSNKTLKPNPLPVPRPRDWTVDERPKAKAKTSPPPAGPQRKLGKLAVKHDARTPYLTEFLVRADLPAPEPFDWLTAGKLPDDLGMLGNDVAGNCTCAAILHMLQVQNAVNGNFVPNYDQLTGAAIDLYKKITLAVNGVAYDPADPTTDTGLALLDVLNFCRKQGLIGAFVKLRHEDVAEIEVGGRLFGGLYTGAMLPTSAQTQLDDGQVWSATTGPGSDPGSWGGHAMYLGAGNGDVVDYVTWAKRQAATYEWVAANADEMYAVIDEAWVTGERPAPGGFDMEKLRNYLAAL